MRPELLYQELKTLADKLGVLVEEHNFRSTGLRIKSGACIVHGKHLVIIDKHKSIGKKVKILASMLSKLQHEDVYTVPAVRELLSKYAGE